MSKQLHNSYLQWKKDYGLTAEPEYQSSQDYDFKKAFQAGYELGKKDCKNESYIIDMRSSLRDKLFNILWEFCGLVEVTISHIEVHQTFVVELTFDVPSEDNKLQSCYEYMITSTSYNEHTCTVKVRSVTSNIEQVYIKLIKDLT